MCGVVWISSEHRSSSPKRENRIHPLDGERLQKKERKKGNAAKCRRLGALLGIGQEFSKMQIVNTCLIERVERNSEIVRQDLI